MFSPKDGEKYIAWLQNLSKDIVSLDTLVMTPLGDEVPLIEVLEDSSPTVEDVTVQKDTREYLIKTLEKILSPKELVIVMMRHGFDDSEPKTLEEIGNRFSISRERIRQIEEGAYKKLKARLKEEDYERE